MLSAAPALSLREQRARSCDEWGQALFVRPPRPPESPPERRSIQAEEFKKALFPFTKSLGRSTLTSMAIVAGLSDIVDRLEMARRGLCSHG